MKKTAQDVVRKWYETNDISLLSPEINWHVLKTFPSGGKYTTSKEVVETFFPSVKSHFADYQTIPEIFLSDGFTVVSRGRYCITSHSSKSIEADFAHFWTVQDGLITSFRQITDTVVIASIMQSGS